MIRNRKIRCVGLVGVAIVMLAMQAKKPTIYLVGDSTVRNNHEIQRGWGTHLADYLDTTRISVENRAMAGRSTRTFIKEGRWDSIYSLLKKGDYVFMQFGHNEGSEPDTTRAGYRGVLRGTGEETKTLVWPDGTKETVHTYGWYLRKFIRDTKAKGAIPVVLSMIPRNRWIAGKVERADRDFGKWAKEVAEAEDVCFIDLNKRTADKFDAMGPQQVAAFFHGDHTHTNEAGARLNAQSVAEGIRDNKKIRLRKMLNDRIK